MNRQSIRLKGFDYSQNGYYFVTICSQNRGDMFGKIQNKRVDTSVDPYVYMLLNNIGRMVEYWLEEISNRYPFINIDEWVIMPNHLHLILIINNVGVDRCVDPKRLGDIVRWFKTMSTNQYLREMKNKKWPVFKKRIWHRNYYEHVIRNDKEYWAIKKYIKNNVSNWLKEKENLNFYKQ